MEKSIKKPKIQKKRIYAKIKKPYFKVKQKNKLYNIIDYFAELHHKEDDPWFLFASHYFESEYNCEPVYDIDGIRLEEIISYIKDYKDQVNFILYLKNLKSFNPITDFIPFEDLGPHWGKMVEQIVKECNDKYDYLYEIKSSSIRSKSSRIGNIYTINNQKIKDLPFEIHNHLDFYIAYDVESKFFILKTNPLFKVRWDLSELFNKIHSLYPNLFYKHGAGFFIKSKKDVIVSKEMFNNLTEIIENE